MRNCIGGLMLLVGSIAWADDAEKPIDKPVAEVSASDSTAWRFCLQDPSDRKMPRKLSEEKRAAWLAAQEVAVTAQVNTEAEAAKLPTRELQLKAGSAPKDIKEKAMVLRFQKQQSEDQIEVLKLRRQQTEKRLDDRVRQIELRIRQLRKLQLPEQQA